MAKWIFLGWNFLAPLATTDGSAWCFMNIYRSERNYHIFQHFEMKQLFRRHLLIFHRRAIKLCKNFFYEVKRLKKRVKEWTRDNLGNQQQQQLFRRACTYSPVWFSFEKFNDLIGWQLSLLRVLIKTISLTKEMACDRINLRGLKLAIKWDYQLEIREIYSKTNPVSIWLCDDFNSIRKVDELDQIILVLHFWGFQNIFNIWMNKNCRFSQFGSSFRPKFISTRTFHSSAFNLVAEIISDLSTVIFTMESARIQSKKRRVDLILANFRSYFRNCFGCALHWRLRLHLCTRNCCGNWPQLDKMTRILFCGSSYDRERHKTYRNKSY